MTAQHESLIIALEAAVPLHIIELRDRTPEQRAAIARRAASVVASKGDVLQFGSKRRGAVAEVFNSLACGLACLAFQVGGVTFADQHWCTDHAVCTGDKPEPHPPAPLASRVPRPIVDLELPA